MKIYFVGSISGKAKYEQHYKDIVKALKKLGHKVIEDTVAPLKEEVYGLSDNEKNDYYKQVIKWIKASDLVVAEASYPSIGVGHEISLAIEKGKPVVVLHTESESSHFLEGIESDRVFVGSYDLKDVDKVLSDAIEYVKNAVDTRFNFFISPSHSSYLDWIAKNRRIPRAVYLRNLIKQDMQHHPEFSS